MRMQRTPPRYPKASRRGWLFIAGLCLPFAAHAQTSSVNGTVALSSQLVDRGYAVTGDTPVLQGAVSWTLPSGWALGASASTELRHPTPLAEAFAQASRYWRLSPDWQLEAGLVYYDYPGRPAAGFNRVEASVNAIYRDVLTVGTSAIHPVSGQDRNWRGAADVDFHWPLPLHLSFSAGAGYAQAPVRYGYRVYVEDEGYHYVHGQRVDAYGYGHVGLVWSRGPWRVELDRVIIDADMRRAWGDLAASPWVGTISLDF